MWISLLAKITYAALLTLGYCFCISFLIFNDFRIRRIKNAFFVVLITPVVFFLYNNSLTSHLIFSLIMIIGITIIYRQKLFFSSYTTALSYFIIMFSSCITGIIGITLFKLPIIQELTGLFSDYRLNVLRLIIVGVLIAVLNKFKLMLARRLSEQKKKASPLHNINFLALLFAMIASNIFIRYVSINTINISEIKNLNELLFMGYFLFLISNFYFIYSMNTHIFDYQKIIEIKEYAETDIMTGVLNRQAGLAQLAERIMYTKKTSTELTICFVDINNLKCVNDKYGHNEGDLLIEIVSEIIKEGLREFDFVCRLGGDEFLVVFNKCSLSLAESAWRRIYNNISKINENPEIPFPISVSYGFAEYNPIESLSIKDYIDRADGAMYENKKKYKSLKSKIESVEVETS